jgi:hypothetical protein
MPANARLCLPCNQTSGALLALGSVCWCCVQCPVDLSCPTHQRATQRTDGCPIGAASHGKAQCRYSAPDRLVELSARAVVLSTPRIWLLPSAAAPILGPGVRGGGKRGFQGCNEVSQTRI